MKNAVDLNRILLNFKLYQVDIKKVLTKKMQNSTFYRDKLGEQKILQRVHFAGFHFKSKILATLGPSSGYTGFVTNHHLSYTEVGTYEIGALIHSMKLFSPEVTLFSINLPHNYAWNTGVMSGVVPLVATWNCWISYKNGYEGLFVLDFRSLHLWPCSLSKCRQLKSFL